MKRIKFDRTDYPKVCREKAKIEIKTCLARGSYKSHGTGETIFSWDLVSPQNLLQASKALAEHVLHLKFCHGSESFGHAWIEIAGVELGWSDCKFNGLLNQTPTEAATELIDSIFNGQLAADRRNEKIFEAEVVAETCAEIRREIKDQNWIKKGRNKKGVERDWLKLGVEPWNPTDPEDGGWRPCPDCGGVADMQNYCDMCNNTGEVQWSCCYCKVCGDAIPNDTWDDMAYDPDFIAVCNKCCLKT